MVPSVLTADYKQQDGAWGPGLGTTDWFSKCHVLNKLVATGITAVNWSSSLTACVVHVQVVYNLRVSPGLYLSSHSLDREDQDVCDGMLVPFAEFPLFISVCAASF